MDGITWMLRALPALAWLITVGAVASAVWLLWPLVERAFARDDEDHE